jgi:hypothetical protein
MSNGESGNKAFNQKRPLLTIINSGQHGKNYCGVIANVIRHRSPYRCIRRHHRRHADHFVETNPEQHE